MQRTVKIKRMQVHLNSLRLASNQKQANFSQLNTLNTSKNSENEMKNV